MAWFDTLSHIFVISLLRRSDRREVLYKELDAMGVPSYRTWFAIENKDGAKGLCQTMATLLDHCIEKEYERVLILEDDCTFIQPNEIIEKTFEQLPEDFHLFYLGGTLMTMPQRISENILRTPGVYASHAIVYSNKGLHAAKYALDHKKNTPYDVLLQYYGHQMNRYYAYPMICNQRPGISDIHIPTPHEIEYNTVMKQFYDKETKITDWGSFMEKQFEIMTKNI